MILRIGLEVNRRLAVILHLDALVNAFKYVLRSVVSVVQTGSSSLFSSVACIVI